MKFKASACRRFSTWTIFPLETENATHRSHREGLATLYNFTFSSRRASKLSEFRITTSTIAGLGPKYFFDISCQWHTPNWDFSHTFPGCAREFPTLIARHWDMRANQPRTGKLTAKRILGRIWKCAGKRTNSCADETRHCPRWPTDELNKLKFRGSQCCRRGFLQMIGVVNWRAELLRRNAECGGICNFWYFIGFILLRLC